MLKKVLALFCFALILVTAVLASTGSMNLTANYMDIKIVVDGVLITPKDVNGVYVEPFASNGTTYLPVRAVGEAFGKEVSWDSKTATVYIGGVVDKVAKDVYLWDKPYIECSRPNWYKAYEDKGSNYVGFYSNPSDVTERNDGRWEAIEYVIFPANGLAESIKGTMLLTDSGGSPEVTFEICDENENVLYKSPIFNGSTKPISFNVSLNNALSVMIKITHVNDHSWNGRHACNALIENLTLVTTDY